MRPTAFNVIVFAVGYTLAVVGLIAIGHALIT